MGRSDGARDYGLGWRLVRGGLLAGGALEVAVEARRQEAAGDAIAPDRQVGFRVTARW